MVVTPVWRRRPVFVTSPFCDMTAEREYLGTSVFPELDKRLHERRHQLEPIDLRREVQRDTAEEQALAEFLALKVCLAEIDRARPLQIVLLGDRYGWVPPEDRAQAAVEETGFQTDVAGKSNVALEIEFGLEGDSEGRQQCFFYFREPLDYDRMPPEVAAEYSGAPHADKLAKLKQRIEREMPDRVRHYRAEWDDENNTVAGLDDLGRMVLEDLWKVLDDQTGAYADLPPPTWQDEQRWLLERFVESRGEGFVGRGKLVNDLVELARSPVGQSGAWGACVTGASGIGKSALFARLHRALEQEDGILLAHAAGTGPRSIQVDAMLRHWTLQLAEALGIDAPASDASKSREVEAAFVQLLARASETRRVVLLVDALDQFEPTPRARQLTWLPEPWPDNVRLIVTAVPGMASESLERRAGVELAPLGPLDSEEVCQMADAVCRRRRRELNPKVLDVLASKKLPGGAAAVGVPLWLESALEELNLLDADDLAQDGDRPDGTPREQLDRLILEVAEKLPADVEALYGWILDRNQERLGAGWACGFANLIAAVRCGLRESDIEVLLPKVTRLFEPTGPRRAWDGLRFAVLRRAFRGQLVRCGADGGWDFAHARFRESIRRRYLRDPQLAQRLHASIAYHLKSLPTSDPLRQTELMVHLIAGEDRLRAAHSYSGELPEEELAGATRALVDHILAGSSQTPNEGLGWTASLLIEPKLKRDQVGALCRRYNSDLLDALEDNAPIDACKRLAEATRQAAQELTEEEPGNPEWQQLMVASYGRLATFHEQSGNQPEAGTCWRRCHDTLSAMRDTHGALDPPLAELLSDLDSRL